MKKILKSLALIIIITLIATNFVACGKTNRTIEESSIVNDENSVAIEESSVTIEKDSVVIVASSDIMEITSGTTLLDYMEALESKDKLTYETTESSYGAFVTSINDKTAGLTESWMIYTSDKDNSNSEWGTVTYKEVVYNSASTGASSLIIIEGETYIFALQSF